MIKTSVKGTKLERTGNIDALLHCSRDPAEQQEEVMAGHGWTRIHIVRLSRAKNVWARTVPWLYRKNQFLFIYLYYIS